MRSHCIHIRWPLILNKQTNKISIGKEVEKLEPLCTVSGNGTME